MLFDISESLAKLRIGLSQGLFRIHFELSRQVYQDEKQIADLAFDFRRSAGLTRGGELAKLFIQFIEHLAGMLPIEADGCCFGTDLLGFHQRGEIARHRIQAALRSACLWPSFHLL